LANHVAEYDEQNKFYDGRRTYLGVDSNSKKEKKVFLQLAAVCHQTGKSLRKCSVCIDKDKTVIQKKRKGNNVWNDQDEFNNKRVIQVEYSFFQFSASGRWEHKQIVSHVFLMANYSIK
jgi:hypothetical protein